MTFSIGVIGAGAHGMRYVRHALRDVPGMTVAALCRRDETEGRRLADESGCRYHGSPSALIADPAVDGVVVCTPPSSHFFLARQVLDAGKNLLLEKPMTGTLAQAEQLAQIDAGGSSPLMVAQALRWNPVIGQVAALMPRLGPIRHLRLAQRLAPTNLAWQRDPHQTVGGSVLLTGVHIFDLARFLTGEEFIAVESRQWQILNPAVEDFFLARATMTGGCQVSLEVSKYTHSRACWLEVVGQEGQIHADYLDQGITFRTGKTEETYDVSAAVPTLPLLLADWLACVREGSPPPVTVDDGLATLRMVEACYRSHVTGREVAL